LDFKKKIKGSRGKFIKTANWIQKPSKIKRPDILIFITIHCIWEKIIVSSVIKGEVLNIIILTQKQRIIKRPDVPVL